MQPLLVVIVTSSYLGQLHQTIDTSKHHMLAYKEPNQPFSLVFESLFIPQKEAEAMGAKRRKYVNQISNKHKFKMRLIPASLPICMHYFLHTRWATLFRPLPIRVHNILNTLF